MKNQTLMLVKKVIKHVGMTTLDNASAYACYEPKISNELKTSIMKSKLDKKN